MESNTLTRLLDSLASAIKEEEWGTYLAQLTAELKHMWALQAMGDEKSNLLMLHDVVWGLQFQYTSVEQYQALRKLFSQEVWKTENPRTLDTQLLGLKFETIPSDVFGKNFAKFGPK